MSHYEGVIPGVGPQNAILKSIEGWAMLQIAAGSVCAMVRNPHNTKSLKRHYTVLVNTSFIFSPNAFIVNGFCMKD